MLAVLLAEFGSSVSLLVVLLRVSVAGLTAFAPRLCRLALLPLAKLARWQLMWPAKSLLQPSPGRKPTSEPKLVKLAAAGIVRVKTTFSAGSGPLLVTPTSISSGSPTLALDGPDRLAARSAARARIVVSLVAVLLALSGSRVSLLVVLLSVSVPALTAVAPRLCRLALLPLARLARWQLMWPAKSLLQPSPGRKPTSEPKLVKLAAAGIVRVKTTFSAGSGPLLVTPTSISSGSPTLALDWPDRLAARSAARARIVVSLVAVLLALSGSRGSLLTVLLSVSRAGLTAFAPRLCKLALLPLAKLARWQLIWPAKSLLQPSPGRKPTSEPKLVKLAAAGIVRVKTTFSAGSGPLLVTPTSISSGSPTLALDGPDRLAARSAARARIVVSLVAVLLALSGSRVSLLVVLLRVSVAGLTAFAPRLCRLAL